MYIDNTYNIVKKTAKLRNLKARYAIHLSMVGKYSFKGLKLLYLGIMVINTKKL